MKNTAHAEYVHAAGWLQREFGTAQPLLRIYTHVQLHVYPATVKRVCGGGHRWLVKW